MKGFREYCLEHKLPKRKITTDIITESDPEWKKRLQESNWWESNNIQTPEMFLKATRAQAENLEYFTKQHQDFVFLHNVLLKIGGFETCFPIYEDDMEAILTRGRYFYGHSRMMKGQPSQCHRNSCELWELNHDEHNISICTGYALSEDGIWRQHSWILLIEDCREILIETAIKRKAYYGFVMNDDEAQEFVDENF